MDNDLCDSVNSFKIALRTNDIFVPSNCGAIKKVCNCIYVTFVYLGWLGYLFKFTILFKLILRVSGIHYGYLL